ncbi:MAG: 50S ribosomal protein L21 [Proteobacteria bacterium]|nr:MAG: 50S ribosomal protein L21 [Pseudomonadota bacterium]
MYAVISTGGKQYKVKKGDAIQVELLNLDMGGTMSFPEVLLVGAGAGIKIGQPFVSSASVSAEVVAIEKGPKIIVYHKKRRKQSDKKNGHRQPYTRLLITGIDNGAGEKDTLSADDRKKVMSQVGFAFADAWAVTDDLETASGAKAPAAPKATKVAAPKAPKAGLAKPPVKKAAPKKAASKAKTE